MQIARVIGTVVATQKHRKFEGAKLLLGGGAWLWAGQKRLIGGGGGR